uniref:Uncharacterized protein n=1 Tax=Arundo donax TaxID=35708 RepID=A0A0A9EBW1_ARUDO
MELRIYKLLLLLQGWGGWLLKQRMNMSA